ncbi:hypothetical protein MJM95_20195, partial [Salmonella enterica subsp. enterica serovar Anatum]|nr:hypothetical protein [Salmonella enterica subsp. enterica serovar Anatum]
PKLAAGNTQNCRRRMLTRQDLEAAKARNNFDRQSRNLQQLNEYIVLETIPPGVIGAASLDTDSAQKPERTRST